MGSVNEKMISGDLIQNPSDISKAASTSFNVSKVSDLNDKFPLMYPVSSQPGNHQIANDAQYNGSNGSSKRKIVTQYKSPYNVSAKKKDAIGSKKHSIESDPKDLSTNVPNTYHSDTRYKVQISNGKSGDGILRAQILNAKNEQSSRLPAESSIREQSLKSHEQSIKIGKFKIS